MRPETETKLEKVQRMSARLRVVCRGLAVLTGVLFVVASAGVLAGSGVTVSFRAWRIPVEQLALWGRLVVTVLLALSMGVLLKGLRHLDRLFGDYASGKIFTTDAAAQIRQLGITSILWTGVNVAWVLAAFGMASPRPASFSLHFDSLIIGAIVIVISWFMDAAAEMREESDLTI